jgi:hypothetical protein
VLAQLEGLRELQLLQQQATAAAGGANAAAPSPIVDLDDNRDWSWPDFKRFVPGSPRAQLNV